MIKLYFDDYSKIINNYLKGADLSRTLKFTIDKHCAFKDALWVTFITLFAWVIHNIGFYLLPLAIDPQTFIIIFLV